jgi:hypothetical protein
MTPGTKFFLAFLIEKAILMGSIQGQLNQHCDFDDLLAVPSI